TKITFKIHPLPEAQCMGAFEFDAFGDGLEAIRQMLRDGYKPALVRLYDASESKRHFSGVAGRGKSVLLLITEGKSRIATVEFEECAAIAKTHGSDTLGEQPVRHWLEHRFDIPDLDDLATRKGVVFDTIEVAANWDCILDVYHNAIAALKQVPGIINASA